MDIKMSVIVVITMIESDAMIYIYIYIYKWLRQRNSEQVPILTVYESLENQHQGKINLREENSYC